LEDFGRLMDDLRIFLLAHDFRMILYELSEESVNWTGIMCALSANIEDDLSVRRTLLRLLRYLKLKGSEHLRDFPVMILNTLNRLLTKYPADAAAISFSLQVIKDYCGLEECLTVPVEDSILKLLRSTSCNDKLKAMSVAVLAEKFKCPFDRVKVYLSSVEEGSVSAVLAAALKIHYSVGLSAPRSSSQVMNLINGWTEVSEDILCATESCDNQGARTVEEAVYLTREIREQVLVRVVSEEDFQTLCGMTDMNDRIRSANLPFQVYAFRVLSGYKEQLEPNATFQLVLLAEKLVELYKDNFDAHLYMHVFEGFLSGIPRSN
jgi:hypothetical protein